MTKKPFREPRIPVVQMMIFGVGVALLAMINSCGFKTVRVAHALPMDKKYIVQGSIDTAVVTAQHAEKRNLKLTIASSTFEGGVDIRIYHPQISKIDAANTVRFKAEPAFLTLSKNTEAEVTISVEVAAGAPAVKEKPFRIVVYKSGTREVVYRTDVDLNVLPNVAVSQ